MVDPNISVCFPSLTLLYYHHRHFGVCLGLSFIFCLHSVGTGFFSLAFPSSSHWDPGNDRTAICEVKSFPVQMVNTIYDELDCLLAHDIPLFLHYSLIHIEIRLLLPLDELFLPVDFHTYKCG